MQRSISVADLRLLEESVVLLEGNNFVVRVSAYLGNKIETALNKLPAGAVDAINEACSVALNAALTAAGWTTSETNRQASWDKVHKLAAMVSGAGGGFFGYVGASIEIPVTTTIIFRSILDIARSEGADISSIDTRLECVNVFAFGGPSDTDDSAESSYFTTRAGLSIATRRAAARFASAKGQKEAARIASNLSAYLSKIAGRYAPVVSEKFIAEAIPVLGAIGGAVINVAFIDHFQDKARGHFSLLRLEGEYGAKLVRLEYEKIRERLKKNKKRKKAR